MFCFCRDSPQWARVSFHTQGRTTVCRTSLDEWSTRRVDFFRPDNTQQSQQTNIHAPGGIRTHNLSRRAAADLHLIPRGHCPIYIYIYTYTHTYTYTHIQLHVFGLKRKILGRRLAVCLWPGVPIGWQDGCNLLTLFSLSFGNNRVLWNVTT